MLDVSVLWRKALTKMQETSHHLSHGQTEENICSFHKTTRWSYNSPLKWCLILFQAKLAFIDRSVTHIVRVDINELAGCSLFVHATPWFTQTQRDLRVRNRFQCLMEHKDMFLKMGGLQ